MEWLNVVSCCVTCNRKKGGRTPDEADMPLLRHPVAPDHLNKLLELSYGDSIPDSWKEWLR